MSESFSKNRNLDNNRGDEHSLVSKDRPVPRLGQVLTPSEIRVGQWYYSVYERSGEIQRIKVVEGLDETTQQYVYVEKRVKGFKPPIVVRIYLADKSVIPYDNGMWNTQNYLLKNRKRYRERAKQMKEKISD